MRLDIIGVLVSEHTNVKPVFVQKLDVLATLLVLQEDVDVKRICATLQSID